MLKINAKNKSQTLKDNNKLYWVLVIGFLLTFLSFLLYKDIIVTITLGVSTIIFYFIIKKEPENITLVLDENGISLNENFRNWVEYDSFGIIKYDDQIEIVLFVATGRGVFKYLFFEKNQPGVKELITELTKHIPYNENVFNLDKKVVVLRRMGLH